MNKRLFFSVIFFFSFNNSYGMDFCARTQKDIRASLLTVESRIAFDNDGGLMNGGVCWWHARLQRSSAYLVKFRPEKNLPTSGELRNILQSLRQMNKVVVIPGFSDFETFSKTYQKEIQSMLEKWQKSDGFFNFAWVTGISGSSSLEPQKMRLQMDRVYQAYKKSPTPLWVMAQIKGITSHSLLILNMLSTPTGYELSVIDSNYSSKTIRISYNVGDRSLRATGEDYSFVPYVGFQNDFKSISAALQNECGNRESVIELESLPTGDVELAPAVLRNSI